MLPHLSSHCLLHPCSLHLVVILSTVSSCRMSTPTQTAAEGAQEENVLKRKSDDIGWENGLLVDPKDKEIRCLICGYLSSGGIYCLKQHVAHIGSTVAKCVRYIILVV
ncbi:hypothetical protein EJB05_48981 [Eragrostis curvula]|uniref:BED-type domain-containing protein n=1 Tax=Eragrostis curvula TaxID=38414 RepID=A0A5J9T477_9POAL|nr:hypothetical protein EJB05_48981 [Eragrostis curvula]